MKLNPFKKKEPQHTCLICMKTAGSNPSDVRYKYQDGEGVAYLCDVCSEEFNKDTVDRDQENDISV